MLRSYKKPALIILILFIGIITGLALRHFNSTWSFIKNPIVNLIKNKNRKWNNEFFLIDLKSSIDNNVQKIYCYKSNAKEKKPLIVSLHTWSGNYSQTDELAEMCKAKNINYIHPDFRGSNKTINACCSKLALTDIDDAINHAITNFNIDTSKIYVIGVSGGGYATLSTFMKSRHNIKKFSAWASITNLVAWYDETKIRNSEHSKDILNCTNSTTKLNIKNAKQKSPIFWKTPREKLKDSKLSIYAGILDGIQGNVPITHSINIYNKILSDLSVKDTSKYVSDSEKLKLIEFKKPISDYGYIGNRKICLKKKYKNISLTIFDGNHEMLTEFAFNELIKD